MSENSNSGCGFLSCFGEIIGFFLLCMLISFLFGSGDFYNKGVEKIKQVVHSFSSDSDSINCDSIQATDTIVYQ